MGGFAALAGYLALVVGVVGLIVIATHLLGEKHRESGTGVPYESGVLPSSPGHLRFPSDFYLIAMFFVIFDVAAVFLFAWAVSVRELGWGGLVAVLVFSIETVAALAYIWKSGAFDWGKARKLAHLKRHGLKP
jgi:NADH-quinone oxidoreductase subunit A